MTTQTLQDRTTSRTPSEDNPRGGGAYRAAIIAVLVLALIAAGATRHLAQVVRDKAVSTAPARAPLAGRSSLSSMNSYALALLLGGLRGPLVMVLWTSSESQKNEKNLEDFDTKVEWIRLLQPEFDTVHIFQMWNKAYNISVQMASLANKYMTILDALDYAYSVDAERPENINIITGIAQIYFDKLGNSAEKAYYRKRVRAETVPHELRQKLSRDDPAWRRIEHDAWLDAAGKIIPSLRDQELPHLVQYEPFPQGLAPFAIAYNYHKRAQILQNAGKQRHAQMSDLVIDSRPALALKNWAEEEQERGRRTEMEAFGRPVPAERVDMELPAGDVAPDAKPRNPVLVDAALYNYALADRLAKDAITDYNDHLTRYMDNASTYQSHIDGLEALAAMSRADVAYLKLVQGAGDREAIKKEAVVAYNDAIRRYLRIILRYYTEDDILAALLPRGASKTEVAKLSDAQLMAAAALSQQAMAQRPYDQYAEDRGEYEGYIRRAALRLDQLGATPLGLGK